MISNTSQVIAGGGLSILRKKSHKTAQSNFGPSRLSNDIQSLIEDFHKDADTFVNVSVFWTNHILIGCPLENSRKAADKIKSAT